MITHQAFCGTLLAGERKSDRPYICAIVQHNFDPRICREMIEAGWHAHEAASVRDHIRYNRARAGLKAGQHLPGRIYPCTQAEIDDALSWLGGLDDEAILAREYAARAAAGERTIEKAMSAPVVLSWHMTADNGQKALAAARSKSWLRCWALALVPTATKVTKARKAKDDTEPRVVG